MTEPWAIIAVIDGVARVVAITATSDACEWLRQVVSLHLRAPTMCQALGRAV